jgi:uncharacterized protein (DUF4415 family)
MAENEDIVRVIAELDTGEIIVEHADGRLEKTVSGTDWNRLRAMSDEEIEANAAADEENPPLDAAFFRAMKPLSTARKQRVTMFLDDDVLDYFRRGDRGYQTRINAILRQYVEAKR